MSETPLFTDVTVPPTDDVPPTGQTEDPPSSTDLACRVCSAPLSYSGRGRKPTLCDEHKRATTPRTTTGVRSTGHVNAAMAQMDVAYSLLATAFMMISPAAAMDFSNRVEIAQNINRQAFESDPALAKRIGGVSGSMAPLMFYGANAFLIGPPLRVAYAELVARRVERKSVPTDAPPFVDFGDVPQNGNGPT